MDELKKKIPKKLHNQIGASAIEYALVLVVIVTMVMAGAKAMKQPLDEFFVCAASKVASYVTGEEPNCGGSSGTDNSYDSYVQTDPEPNQYSEIEPSDSQDTDIDTSGSDDDYSVIGPESSTEEAISAVIEAGPLDALEARENANEAHSIVNNLARQKFPNAPTDPQERQKLREYLHNGEGDAIRHCVWNCRNASMMPANDARQIGDNHEDVGDANNQPADERTMDEHNNEVGIQLGIDNSGDAGACTQACSQAYGSGNLCSIRDANNSC